jgi:nucleoside-diphosphate-sugar epimerase/glycosyltransferase involved in cell wall biosynthesis
MSKLRNSLSIVVPAYNEEKNLEPTITHIIAASPYLIGQFEIIIVNDCSNDQTGAVAECLVKTYPFVRVVHSSTNLGFGGAYKEGVQKAVLDYVLMVPGDDAYPIASLERIFAKVGSADIVMSYTTNMEIRSWSRRLISDTFVFAMNILFQLRLKYYNGVTVLPTATAQTLQFSSGFSYAAENMVRLIKLHRFSYEQVPCEITERKMGKSSALKAKNIWSVLTGVTALVLEVYGAGIRGLFKNENDSAKKQSIDFLEWENNVANEIKFKKVCITGGAGYVGSALVPFLMERGYDVTVLDLFWYGDEFFSHLLSSQSKGSLRLVKGDIRDQETLDKAFAGQDAVIHLACISNDPSYDLNPNLGKTINYDAFGKILKALKQTNVKRFLYASSSSVYGVKDIPNVTEEASCEPLTDYSKFKLLCEQDLKTADVGTMEWSIIRPATVCGYGPRLRLDLTVNILTTHGLEKNKITVHGGDQLRPNLNIKDMIRAYALFLEAEKEKIHGKTFNVGFENKSVGNIAEMVKTELAAQSTGGVEIVVEPTKDHRSYHVNSDKVFRELGFRPEHTIQDAIRSLIEAHRSGKIPDAMTNPNYYNIRQMQSLKVEDAL